MKNVVKFFEKKIKMLKDEKNLRILEALIFASEKAIHLNDIKEDYLNLKI